MRQVFDVLTFFLPARLAPPSRTTASSRTASEAAAIFLGSGFINVKRSIIEHCAIDRRNCLVGFSGVGHFHKREPTRATCVAIPHYRHAINCAMRLEQRSNVIFRGVKVQISNENLLQGSAFPICFRAVRCLLTPNAAEASKCDFSIAGIRRERECAC
jgi:hypothetical protein